MNRKIRIIALFLILLGLAVLIDLAEWYLSPVSLSFSQEGEVTEISPGQRMIAQDNNESNLSAEEVFCYTINCETARSLVIHYEEPLTKDALIQIVYSNTESEARLQKRSKILTAHKGVSDIPFNTPDGYWNTATIYTSSHTGISRLTSATGKTFQQHQPYRFRIMGILVTYALLCGIVLVISVLKKNRTIRLALTWLDEQVINPNTRKRIINIIYIIYALLMILHHIWTTIYYPIGKSGKDLLQIEWLIFAGISIILGKMWKDKGFWLLLCLWLLKYFRLVLEDYYIVDEYSYSQMLGIYAFFGCYSIGRVLCPKCRKIILIIFCSLWTLGMTVLSCLGIYAAWTDSVIINAGDGAIRLYYDRLKMIYHMVESGILASTSIAVAFVGLNVVKNRIIRFLYILFSVVIMIAGVLTGTRTAYFILAIEIALLVCLFLYDKLRPQKRSNTYQLPFKKWLIIFCVFPL